MRNYTGHRWEGENYKRGQDITDVAKSLRKQLKTQFPKCKFSVTVERYSMGQSLHVSLMQAPFRAIVSDKGHCQLNQYSFNGDYEEGLNNGTRLTPEAWDVMKKVYHLANSYNYDDSDGMIDYFDTNFYLHMNIGKWNKPFVQVMEVKQ